MSLLLFLGTVAVGWLVAVGVDTKQGWRPPIPWFGWREVHPFARCLSVIAASWLLQAWLTENGRPEGPLNAVLAGCLVLQVVLGLAAAGHALFWGIAAHAARTILRNAGLSDGEIQALQAVNERSPIDELMPALAGFTKLGRRVAAVEAAFAASRADRVVDEALGVAPAEETRERGPRVYSISDLIRYYALSGNGSIPGVWQDCYLALCRAYHVPPDWQRDQGARMRGNEWRDQETAPEQHPYNLSYADYRLAFEQVRLKPMGQLVGPGEGELDQAVYHRVMAAMTALDKPLRELDRAFFAGVYGAPAALTLIESTLVVHYGFPDSQAQAEYWVASL